MDAVNRFYIVCSFFNDDYELVTCAFKELADAKERPSVIYNWCENLWVRRLSVYTDKILDTDMDTIRKWRKSKQKKQLCLFEEM